MVFFAEMNKCNQMLTSTLIDHDSHTYDTDCNTSEVSHILLPVLAD